MTAPGGAVGTLAARAPTDGAAVLRLEQEDGDLSAGQAKGELLDPATLPADTVQTIELNDDGNGEDGEDADGVYTGTFAAAWPGRYGVDLHVEHDGVLTPPG